MKYTVHRAPWDDLKNKKEIVVRAAANVNINLYWRQSYVVLHTMVPSLLGLRLAYSKKSTMDKIYYYVHMANLAIKKNPDNPKNPILFPPPEEDDGENGYDYSESSTEESDYDEDVGPGDDLYDSDKCRNTESDGDNEYGTLSR